MVGPKEKILAADLAGAIAKAGVNLTLEGRTLQDALISAITDCRGYCARTVDHVGWVVTLLHPEEQTFSVRTRSECLAWRQVWLTVPEPRIGQFLGCNGAPVMLVTAC